ncbi:MAG: transglycosylase domain-containing protein [Nitriliruptorales bacterium]
MLALLLVPASLLLLGALLAAIYLFSNVPLPEDVAPQATRVLDRHGQEAGFLSPQAVDPVPLEQLPPHVPRSVLAAEDRSFYRHAGVSVTGTVRALVTNVQAGRVEQGGSTITQQYIKNAAVGTERTFRRKAKEAVLAVKLERRYSKDEILAFYLNTVYFGRGAYGVEAAARTYYGVPAQHLNLNQAATLAGIIRAPERLDPATQSEDANARRIYVLDGMAEEGWLTAVERDGLVRAGLPATASRQRADHGPAAYYLDAVRAELAAKLGEERVYRGLTVRSELDQDMQSAAQRILAAKVAELQREQKGKPVTGAIVSVDPADGGVRALVGGPDFAVQPFNAAIQGLNQAGSAFKPFGLAGFVNDGFSPESRFPAPAELAVPFPGAQPYEVSNFGRRGFGEQTVREATLTSTNTVYVQMAAKIGPDAVKEMAVRAGIDDDLRALPSLILGTADVGAVDMAEAYATFAADGVHHEPRLVRRVEDRTGVAVSDTKPENTRAMDSNVARAVSDLLEDNVRQGTGRAARIGRPAAGKTGTTDDSRDAWFVGYVPQLSTSVWLGTLDNTPMSGVTGAGIPAETWGEYMAEAVEGLPEEDFPAPDYAGLTVLNPLPPPPPPPVTRHCPGPSGQMGEVLLPPDAPCPPLSPAPARTPPGGASEADAVPSPAPVKTPNPGQGGSFPTPSPSRFGRVGTPSN